MNRFRSSSGIAALPLLAGALFWKVEKRKKSFGQLFYSHPSNRHARRVVE
jgi:hypothetical protein